MKVLSALTYQAEGQAIPELHGIFDDEELFERSIRVAMNETPFSDRWRWKAMPVDMNYRIYWKPDT